MRSYQQQYVKLPLKTLSNISANAEINVAVYLPSALKKK
jgi:hypothetical protein